MALSMLDDLCTRHKVLVFLALTALAVAANSNTFWNDFVYDDIRLIKENENLKDLGKLRLAFTADYYVSSTDTERLGYYRPLAILLSFIDYRLWELNPAGYHVTNLLLHIAATLLVFELIRSLAQRNRFAVSAACAALFALHPIHTESVTFISGRVDPLCTVFYLGSLIVAVRTPLEARLGPVHRCLAASVLFLAALLSKEMAVTLPGVLALLLVYQYTTQQGRSFPGAVRASVPRLTWPVVTLGAYLALRFAVLGRLTSMFTQGATDGPMRILLKVIITYLRNLRCLFLPPSYLNLEAEVNFPRVLNLLIFGALMVIGIALGLALLLWRYSRLASVGLLWIFVTLLPVSGVIPIENLLAERFLYLPSVGACLFLGIVAAALLSAGSTGHRALRHRIAMAAGIVGLLSLMGWYLTLSLHKNTYWKDQKTLWSEDLKVDPGSAKAYYNLAHTYLDAGREAEAEQAFIKVLARDPRHYKALSNLGLLYQGQGRFNRAARLFTRAKEVNPGRVSAYYHLGYLNIEARRLPQAIAHFRMALKIDPRHFQSRTNLAMALMFTGQPDEAIEHFQEVLRSHPGEVKALEGLRLARKIRDGTLDTPPPQQ